jgi:hypothetical protein
MIHASPAKWGCHCTVLFRADRLDISLPPEQPAASLYPGAGVRIIGTTFGPPILTAQLKDLSAKKTLTTIIRSDVFYGIISHSRRFAKEENGILGCSG